MGIELLSEGWVELEELLSGEDEVGKSCWAGRAPQGSPCLVMEDSQIVYKVVSSILGPYCSISLIEDYLEYTTLWPLHVHED